jgi:hypothetical protein
LQRVIASFFFGLLFLVTGAIGYRLQHGGPLSGDARWAGRPILSQVALGTGLLILSAFWYRRLPEEYKPMARRRTAAAPKYVGGGKSPAAQQHDAADPPDRVSRA